MFQLCTIASSRFALKQVPGSHLSKFQVHRFKVKKISREKDAGKDNITGSFQ